MSLPRSSEALVTLQRSVGNRAVVEWIAATRVDRTGPGRSTALGLAEPGLSRDQAAHHRGPAPSARPMLQREDQRVKALGKMATPQVFPGPTVKTQDTLAAELDAAYEAKEKDPQTSTNYKLALKDATCLGVIELTNPPGDDLGVLIKAARLKDATAGGLTGRAVSFSTFDLVPEKVKPLIVENTLATMHAAGQLDYLGRSGWLGKGWKVLIEVHYYRDRPPSSTKTHKDTLGQTLFVNLNFLNKQPIAGPEFLANPPNVPAHDKELEKTLPEQFRADLTAVREKLATPTEFGIAELPAKGVVAFVDELIHHKTPTMGHRTVTGSQVRAYLKQTKNDYDGFATAYDRYAKRVLKFRYDTYLPKDLKGKGKATTADTWLSILQATAEPGTKLNRTQLQGLDPSGRILDPSDIDALIDLGSKEDFGTVSIPSTAKLLGGTQSTHTPDIGIPALRRQMSQLLDKGTAPKPMEGKRSFFRTWVRAVPTEQ